MVFVTGTRPPSLTVMARERDWFDMTVLRAYSESDNPSYSSTISSL